MKIALVAMVTVLTAVMVMLGSASRAHQVREDSRVRPVLAADVLPPSDPQVATLQQLLYEVEQGAAQHDATLQALGTLRRAEALLAIGDSDGVDDELSRAETVLSGRTRIDVDAAREALGRSDLFAARQYLAAALAERRAQR